MRPWFEPVPVYVGRAPGYTGPVAMARGGEPPADKTLPAAYAARSPVAGGPLAADPGAKPLQLGAGATQRGVRVANHETDERKGGQAAAKGRHVVEARRHAPKRHRSRR